MAVFVSQVVAKSQIQKIFKSQNLTDFLRFRSIFFSCEVNLYFWKHTQSFKVKQQFRALKLNLGTLCPPPQGITRIQNSGANGKFNIGISKIVLLNCFAKIMINTAIQMIKMELDLFVVPFSLLYQSQFVVLLSRLLKNLCGRPGKSASFKWFYWFPHSGTARYRFYRNKDHVCQWYFWHVQFYVVKLQS